MPRGKSGWGFPVKRTKGWAPQTSVAEVRDLIVLKMRLDAMKPLYAQYDELLQKLLNSGKLNDKPQTVTVDGVKWIIELVDGFALKNTAWKSVATRRYDLALSKARRLR